MITLNRKRLLSMFTLVLSLGLGLTAVSAQSRISPIGLVPPSAVAVAKLNWTVIRQDDRFRRMLNADQLDRALAQLKINGTDISDIVIFSGINSSPTEFSRESLEELTTLLKLHRS